MIRLALVLFSSAALSGCFQAAIDATVREDGRGKLVIQLSVNRSKLPPMFGDPLAGVGEASDLRRYTGPGVVAWAPTQRSRVDDWDRLTMVAYFTDINELRFLRRRDDEIVEILGFDYDPTERPGHIGMRVDLASELRDPLPIPKREGLEMSPDLIRQLAMMFKPMMKELELRLSIHTPGEVSKASGFPHMEGSTAYLLANRDEVFRAMNESAGVLCDVESLLAPDASIEWAPTPQSEDDYDAELTAAKAWWSKKLAELGR